MFLIKKMENCRTAGSTEVIPIGYEDFYFLSEPCLAGLSFHLFVIWLAVRYTVCPTRYRTRHFFNNVATNENSSTKFEAEYRHIPLHFSHKERTAVQMSLQYLHWC